MSTGTHHCAANGRAPANWLAERQRREPAIVGAALARDHVKEVATSIDSSDPADETGTQWMESVHGAAIALDIPLRRLSLGWSRGLGGMVVAIKRTAPCGSRVTVWC